MKKLILLFILIPTVCYAANKVFTATSPLSSTTDNGTHTITIGDASTTARGAASFDSTDFSVSSGAVTITDDGHAHTGTSITGFLVDGC